MKITTVGSDLAKNVFALSGADRRGRVVLREQLRRAQLLSFLGEREPWVVGLEACGGAHHFARAIAALGHMVRLLSPALVAPHRKGPHASALPVASASCAASASMATVTCARF